MEISLIKTLHVCGLIMGFGGAALADYTIFTRCIARPVLPGLVRYIRFLSRIVAAGLAVLWISGLMLVWLKLQTTAEFASNPKLWAKIAIVGVLTINGLMIHRFALRRLEHMTGRRFFDGASVLDRAGLMLCASISSVSWVIPFLLGMLPELNYVVPAATILSIYAACIVVAWATMPMVVHIVMRPRRLAY